MIGLALAGGGVKGAYQVGSYMAFKECGIKFNGVVGTSIGAINGVLIASGKEKELLKFWENTDIGELLGFNKKYIDSVNNEKGFEEFINGIVQISDFIKNKGIDNQKLSNMLKKIIDEDALFNCEIDFGLVTVRFKDKKPLYIFKKDMVKGKVYEYVLASCHLPLFKKTKYIDGEYYLDGGFHDNNPVNMLLNNGYDKVYSIDVHGIGRTQKIIDETKVIIITPSRDLGSILNINKKKINENIKLGYYDTLKVLKKLDGYNFIFKRKSNLLYNILVSHISLKERNKLMNYFKVDNNKDLVIKAIEYVMRKEDISYYNIYSSFKIIKLIKKEYMKDNFIYEFINKLRFL